MKNAARLLAAGGLSVVVLFCLVRRTAAEDMPPATAAKPMAAWTRVMGTGAIDAAFGIAADPGGNVYTAGYTWGGLDGNTNAGGYDLCLIKFDADGVRQWTRQMGTAQGDHAFGVAVDGKGDVYTVGYTAGGLDGNTNAGGYDIFVMKFDKDGVKQWARQMGTALNDFAYGVSVDSAGNVYAAGWTWSGIDGNTNAGKTDFFVVKYDPGGVKQWTRQMGTAMWDIAYGISAGRDGDIYVTGNTWGGLDGNTNAGENDIFVMKLGADGEKKWTRQIGTAAMDEAYGVSLDPEGNAYVCGRTLGALDGNKSAGESDIFVVKYDKNGGKQWTRQTGTDTSDWAYGVSVDLEGNAYVCGRTLGGLDGNENAGEFDLYIAKYDKNGVKQWTRQMGTEEDDYASCVSVSKAGDVYLAGWTSGGLDGNPAFGELDLFIMKPDITPR